MGNCVFKGGFGEEVEEDEEEMVIRVVTSSGGIMELFAPITAECITNEFPGHSIYRTPDYFSQPLLHKEELHAGRLYYLLPNCTNSFAKQSNQNRAVDDVGSNGNNNNSNNKYTNAPYRMSFDQQRIMKRSDAAEVSVPRYNNSSTGVWKVKLVLSAEQLAEILAQEARTEALIESVRTVAKSGNGLSSSVANSDQWSVASSTSRKGLMLKG